MEPTAAPASLEEVRALFEHWRQKKKKRTPIPSEKCRPPGENQGRPACQLKIFSLRTLAEGTRKKSVPESLGRTAVTKSIRKSHMNSNGKETKPLLISRPWPTAPFH